MKTFLSILFIVTLSILTGCTSNTSSLDRAEKNYYAHDYARAFKELWTPVEAHDPRATYAMGYMYYYGIGTDKDQDIGRSLIRRAAAMHYPPAIEALKLITESKHEQYLPFEKYSAGTTPEQENGILEINKPLISRTKV